MSDFITVLTTASGVSLSSFSDPRIAAIQKQIREAETVQAIARLRLVWAKLICSDFKLEPREN